MGFSGKGLNWVREKFQSHFTLKTILIASVISLPNGIEIEWHEIHWTLRTSIPTLYLRKQCKSRSDYKECTNFILILPLDIMLENLTSRKYDLQMLWVKFSDQKCLLKSIWNSKGWMGFPLQSNFIRTLSKKAFETLWKKEIMLSSSIIFLLFPCIVIVPCNFISTFEAHFNMLSTA